MPGSILGTEVRRVEDLELLLGQGTFVDNLDSAGRGPRDLRPQPVRPRPDHRHRHRRGRRGAGRARPSTPPTTSAASRSPASPTSTSRPAAAALAVDKVRYVGDPVALVVAETRAQAMDAAELVDVDYDDLPAVTDMEDALADDAPLQFEAIGSNIATQRAAKDTADVLDDADHVDPGPDGQPAHRHGPDRGQRDPGPADRRRAWRPGSPPSTPTWPATCSPRPSASTPPTSAWSRPTSAAPSAARPAPGPTTPRSRWPRASSASPVKWSETRSEAMLSMQGRGQVQYAELGLKRRRHHHRPADAGARRVRCVRRLRRRARGRADVHDGAGPLRHPAAALRRDRA